MLYCKAVCNTWYASTGVYTARCNEKMVVHVSHVKNSLFLEWCFPAAESFFLSLSATGQARLPWVHCENNKTKYDASLDPGRAPWRCSECSTSLSWLLLVKGLCSAPLRRSGAWKTQLLLFNKSNVLLKKNSALHYHIC